MRIFRKLCFIVTALFVLTLSADKAFAYIDPGTGSMLIQALIAGIAAASVSVGIFWKRIRLFFGRISRVIQREEQGQNEKRGTEPK